MLRRDWRLINFTAIEALPAALARARGNAVARVLAQSDWLLRRKADGRYLAAVSIADGGPRWRDLAPPDVWPREQEQHAGRRDAIAKRLVAEQPTATAGNLPLTQVRRHLTVLSIPDDYGTLHALDLVPEPRTLAFAGFDRYRRPLWLLAPAAAAWQRMRAAALREDVVLDAISGYRSHAYQSGIFARKRARGLTVEQILQVNAAPGYSEHHGGCALDIGTPGEPAAEESFEATPAFAWLSNNAGEFGFRLSYPRGNPHGIVYEPWHWRFEAGKE